MKERRRRYTPEEKVAIIRKHLLDGVGVSDLCDEHQLNPTVYYRWQKEFFEGGAAAFIKDSDRQMGQMKRKLATIGSPLGAKTTPS